MGDDNSSDVADAGGLGRALGLEEAAKVSHASVPPSVSNWIQLYTSR